MKDFYEKFYTAVETSPAHAEFCARVYGRSLCQHGFSDMAQLNALLDMIQLAPGQRALDLGCGNGMIAEYIADRTGAHVTGLDYIPIAIQQAQTRTAAKADGLTFVVGDINALSLADHAFEAIISIDTLYFSQDYAHTIRQLVQTLRPGGQMAFFFAQGREPHVSKGAFHVETLAPDRTPLADALRANGLAFQTRDFTNDDYRLIQRRKQVLADLRPHFEAEDLMFVYENRLGETRGIGQAIEEGLHKRYLYYVRLPGPT